MQRFVKWTVVAGALLAAVAVSQARTMRIEGLEVTKIEIGAVAPEFSLFGVDLRYHSLSHYGDKDAIAVVFHCNHCPVSRMNVDRLVELGNHYQSEHHVQFLLINPNPVDKVAADGFMQMIARAEEKEFPFPYLYDETQQTAAAYGSRRTDTVFLLGPVDEEGNRRVAFIGPVDNRGNEPIHMAVALDQLLAGEEIEPSEIATVGCTSKYRNARERVARFGYDPMAD